VKVAGESAFQYRWPHGRRTLRKRNFFGFSASLGEIGLIGV
jgi:hypothetical protein